MSRRCWRWCGRGTRSDASTLAPAACSSRLTRTSATLPSSKRRTARRRWRRNGRRRSRGLLTSSRWRTRCTRAARCGLSPSLSTASRAQARQRRASTSPATSPPHPWTRAPPPSEPLSSGHSSRRPRSSRRLVTRAPCATTTRPASASCSSCTLAEASCAAGRSRSTCSKSAAWRGTPQASAPSTLSTSSAPLRRRCGASCCSGEPRAARRTRLPRWMASRTSARRGARGGGSPFLDLGDALHISAASALHLSAASATA